MLGKNIDITNHQRNIQLLMTELVKYRNNLAPLIMCNTFIPRINDFDQRNFQEFATERQKNWQMWPGNCKLLLSLALDTCTTTV